MINEDSRTEKDLEEELSRLQDYFGRENLQMDVQQEIIEPNDSEDIFIEELMTKYVKIRVTHVPTGKKAIGISYDSQMKNVIEALQKLKERMETRTPNIMQPPAGEK